MKYGKYAFEIRLKDDAILPRYKGSTFRGVLGHALKRVVCALRNKSCDKCILRSSCIYAMVFETQYAVTSPRVARLSSPPHPMILEPPLTEKTVFQKGETLVCHLILLGDINKNLSYFIYAFDQMGKLGIGKKRRGQRSRFDLETVSINGQTVYDKSDRMVISPTELPWVDLSKMSVNGTFSSDENQQRGVQISPARSSELLITFVTPMRINREDRKAVAPPFEDLIRTMVRRSTALLNVYGNGEPALDYADLIRRAAEITQKDKDVRWYDWQRYSSRQDKKMYLGGITGSVTYSGNVQPFLPLIEMAEKVHLGKNTQFGLGMIRTSYSEAAANLPLSPPDVTQPMR